MFVKNNNNFLFAVSIEILYYSTSIICYRGVAIRLFFHHFLFLDLMSPRNLVYFFVICFVFVLKCVCSRENVVAMLSILSFFILFFCFVSFDIFVSYSHTLYIYCPPWCHRITYSTRSTKIRARFSASISFRSMQFIFFPLLLTIISFFFLF